MKNVVKTSCILLLSVIFTSQLQAQTNIWKHRRTHVRQDLLDVTYGNGLFVAVGQRATIITSPEGKNWTVRSFATNSPNDYQGVAYGNGVFVVVGNGGHKIRTSNDGMTWGQPIHGGNELYDVIYGKGRFVAVGEAILTSTDGTTWTRARRISLAKTIAHGNDRFVIPGENDRIWRSRSGVNWTNTLVDLPGTFTDIVFNGTEFVAFAESPEAIYMFSSPDGINWSPAAVPSFLVNGLARAKEFVVAVGENPATELSGRVQLSATGITWPGEATELARPLYGVIFGQGTILAVGQRGYVVQAELADVIPPGP
jgi:hypothetical protein